MNTRFVYQADGKRAHPSQGQGRAQIVVEPKQELPFEIARGSEGGAAKSSGGPRPVNACNRGLTSFARQIEEKTTRRRISPRSVIEGRTNSAFSLPEVRV